MQSKKVTKPAEIIDIIKSSDVCHLAMVDNNLPYVVPMNFGYHDNVLYFHSGLGGKKLDILEKNPKVCISFNVDNELFIRHEPVACSYSMTSRSVLVYGDVVFVEDYKEKIEALNHIMVQYTGKEFTYNEPAVNNVVIFKVPIGKITAKKRSHS